ncbi:MAG TPA: hypothetical protein ENN14_00680 [Chloroflexi bacterium]|nr:hypothetical protein [Chloroflexota bacterium]
MEQDASLIARLELAAGRLAEDESLTAWLQDDAAQLLLAWGESQVRRLVEATQDLDDEAAWAQLGPQLHALRQEIREAARACALTSDPVQAVRWTLYPQAASAEEAEDDLEA